VIADRIPARIRVDMSRDLLEKKGAA
jgi:hypothetical protein